MADTAARPTRRGPISPPIVPGVAIAITVLPLFVALLAMFGAGMGRVVLWGDDALLELTVRTVGHHLVLLGPYSRYRWHHPGPLLFDWMAIPYHAFGSRPAALYQGALLTAAISVGVVGWVTFRRGGVRFTWCAMALVGMLIWAVGPDVVRAPWNPWITILPLLAVICLAWNATSGEPWTYPMAAAGGTFLVQSHVGYGGVTAAVLAVAGIIVVAQRLRRRAEWRRVGLITLVTAGVLAVLWTPPIYQELRDQHGNISEVRQFFSHTKSDHSLSDGIGVTTHELGAIPAQLIGLDTGAIGRSSPPIWAGIVTLVALALAMAIAARRQAWAALWLTAIVAAGIAAAAWSAARVVGPIENYLVLWVAAVGTGVWIALAAAILAPGSTQIPTRTRRGFGIAVAAVTVGLAIVNTNSALVADPPSAAGATTIPPLVHGIVPALGRPNAGPIYFRLASADAWPFAAGVMLALDRRGYETVIQPNIAWLFGEFKAKPRGLRVASTVTIANSASAPHVRTELGQREVAHGNAYQEMFVFVRPG